VGAGTSYEVIDDPDGCYATYRYVRDMGNIESGRNTFA